MGNIPGLGPQLNALIHTVGKDQLQGAAHIEESGIVPSVGFGGDLRLYATDDIVVSRVLQGKSSALQRGDDDFIIIIGGESDARARQLIDELKPDIFVCGHSHILKVVRDQKRDMLVINPGAAGIQGFHLVRTALRFHIENGRIDRMEVFELDRESFVK